MKLEIQACVIHSVSIISLINAGSKCPRSIILWEEWKVSKFMKNNKNFTVVMRELWVRDMFLPEISFPQGMKGNDLSVKIVNYLSDSEFFHTIRQEIRKKSFSIPISSSTWCSVSFPTNCCATNNIALFYVSLSGIETPVITSL